MILTAFNPDIPEQEVTYLSLVAQPGVTSITVKNNDEFALNDRIMVGQMGNETTEIVSVTGAVTAGTALTVGALTFAHNPDDPVTRLRYDQVKFYRSTNGSGGSYSLLSTVNMDVDGSDEITTYDDTVGLSSYFYKVSFYNSVTTLESALSDPIPGSGYTRNTVGFLYDEFTREVSEQDNLLVDSTEFIGWMNQCSDEIIVNARKPYLFLETRGAYTLTAKKQTFPFPLDANGNQVWWKVNYIDMYYTNPFGATPVVSPDTAPVTPTGTVQKYPLRFIPPEEFDLRYQDQNFITDDLTINYTIDWAQKVLRFNPVPTDGSTIYVYYWKNFTQITSFGNNFETPTYQVYKQFALWRYFMKKAENDDTYMPLANTYQSKYTQELAKLTKYNSRMVGQPRGFEWGASTDANTYDIRRQSYRGWRRF